MVVDIVVEYPQSQPPSGIARLQCPVVGGSACVV